MHDPQQNPFPGMNPYLEDRWQGVHNALVTYLRDALDEILPRGLVPEMDERVFVQALDGTDRAFRPDVFVSEHQPVPGVRPAPAEAPAAPTPILLEMPELDVRESFINIVDAHSGGTVITTIEIVSPSNKSPGEGRRLYLQKQEEARSGGVSLVEVDLLRAGEPVTRAVPSRVPPQYRAPYHVAVHRASAARRLEFYPVHLRRPLPAVGIPLRTIDADAVVELQPLLNHAYTKGRYYDRIDYTQAPQPRLTPDDAVWADAVLRAAGVLG